MLIKTSVIFLFLILNLNIAYTQKEKVIAIERFKVGLFGGMSYPLLSPFEEFSSNSTIYNYLGIRTGIFADYLFNSEKYFRISAGINTNKSKVKYSYNDTYYYDYIIRQMNIDIGLDFVVKYPKRNNFPFFIIGTAIDIPIEGVLEDHDYLPMKNSYSIIPGIGYNIIKKYSINTELRFCKGINNINTFKELGPIQMNNWYLLICIYL